MGVRIPWTPLMVTFGIFLSGCSTSTTIETKTVVPKSLLLLSSSACVARQGGQLPDLRCTPGATDPAVTQQNIHATICVSGYTASVRPPVSVTNALKGSQIALYGYADTNPKDYEEDHLISLELGGAPSDAKNLWPEFGPSPNPKDKVENLLHKLVCAGKMALKTAQALITHDWTAIHFP